jgi:hypothetical protein
MVPGRRTSYLGTIPPELPRLPYIVNRIKRGNLAKKYMGRLLYEKFLVILDFHGDSLDTLFLFWDDGATREWAVCLKPGTNSQQIPPKRQNYSRIPNGTISRKHYNSHNSLTVNSAN